MNKICTDIEQSCRLLELGLDPNSSDMYYTPYPNDEYWYDIPNVGMATKEVNQLSAWSLTALLKLMPKIKAATPILVNALLEEKYYCHYQGIGFYKEVNTTSFQDEPVDAAFEMVCWLLENGYINKSKK